MLTRLAVRPRVAVLVVGLLLVASACATGSSTSGNSGPATGALGAFAAQFDAGVGHRRLVLLMSPTSSTCLGGASWVADNILHAHPDADVRRLAVWQAIEGDGQGSGDPHAILDDPRVAHLTDPDLDIGRWFGDRNHTFHAGAGTAWDAFMLFDSDATFATLAAHLVTGGYTIIGDRSKLAAAFASAG